MTTENLEDIAEKVLEYKEREHEGDQTIWHRADIALHIHDTYGDVVLKTFADQTGEKHVTLRNYKWVAEAYPLVNRVIQVSFSHYQICAKREDRYVWLQKAFDEDWSKRKLEEELAIAGNGERVRVPRGRRLQQVQSSVGQPVLPSNMDPPAEVVPGHELYPDAVRLDELAAVLNWGYVNEAPKFQGMKYTDFLNYAVSRIGKLEFDQIENRFKVTE